MFLAKEYKEQFLLTDRTWLREGLHGTKRPWRNCQDIANEAKCGRPLVGTFRETALTDELYLLKKLLANQEVAARSRELAIDQVEHPDVLDADMSDPCKVLKPRVSGSFFALAQKTLEFGISDPFGAAPVTVVNIRVAQVISIALVAYDWPRDRRLYSHDTKLDSRNLYPEGFPLDLWCERRVEILRDSGGVKRVETLHVDATELTGRILDPKHNIATIIVGEGRHSFGILGSASPIEVCLVLEPAVLTGQEPAWIGRIRTD